MPAGTNRTDQSDPFELTAGAFRADRRASTTGKQPKEITALKPLLFNRRSFPAWNRESRISTPGTDCQLLLPDLSGTGYAGIVGGQCDPESAISGWVLLEQDFRKTPLGGTFRRSLTSSRLFSREAASRLDFPSGRAPLPCKTFEAGAPWPCSCFDFDT